jgi:hypothetical protein
MYFSHHLHTHVHLVLRKMQRRRGQQTLHCTVVTVMSQGVKRKTMDGNGDGDASGSTGKAAKKAVAVDYFDTLAYGAAPESTAAADAWLDRHNRRFGCFVRSATVVM